ncbi:MAG: glutathione S-transferase family protein [Burkholderiaceae bacterium]
MILIGRYRSPFVRRVATTMRYYGMSYEHRPLQHTGEDIPALRAINPIGRIPALVLDDGQVLVESGAIIDYLDREAGPDKALIPPAGKARNHALTLIGVATGSIDKFVACSYEIRFRPEEKRHAPWVERCQGQVQAGFAWLNEQFEGEYMLGDKLSQADITVAIGWQSLGLGMKALQETINAPRLDALVGRMMQDDAFTSTLPPPE